MNTATFRTMIEMMGMEQAWIADQLGVTERSVRRWASPNNNIPVPFGIEDWVNEWWDRFGALCENAIGGALELREGHGSELARYASRDSIKKAGVDMPLSMHSALIGLIAFMLSGEGLDFRVSWTKTDD